MREKGSRSANVDGGLRWGLQYMVAALVVALLAILVAGLFKRKAMNEVELSPVSSMLERLKENDRCNAILAISPDLEGQLDAIELLPERRSLHGVPVLVKDNIDVKGMPTTAGSRALLNNHAETDAPVAANMRTAGALIAGKTNLSEWANFRSTASTSGWSSVGGLTTNPFDSSCSACGSSSGSGAAVGSRLVDIAIGTETDGSITCPAAMCGIVGLKPTVGLLSCDGIVPISASQDTPGPMTRTVRLAALALSAMAGGDSDDYAASLNMGALEGIRLGVLTPLSGMYDDSVSAAFAAARGTLERAGAILVEIHDLPNLREISRLEWQILLREFKRDLNVYLSGRPPSVTTRTLADIIAYNKSHASIMMPHFGQEIFEQSEETEGGDDPELPGLVAKAKRLAGREGIDRLLAENQCEALIAPTTGRAFAINLEGGDEFQGACTTLPAVSGYPHLTVPMGKADGLPVGLSFMGPEFSEARLLAMGFAFEQARRKEPSLTAK